MYDAVVIGAGNGGLVAAVTLAKRGVKTLLLEQHNLPGGFASSFIRGRFEFEPALHEPADIGAPDNPGSLGLLFQELELDVEWAEVHEAYRLITTDDVKGNLDITMPFGIDAFIEHLERLVPGSRPTVSAFMDLSKQVLDGLAYLSDSKGNPDKSVLMKDHANFLKTAPYSVEDVQKKLKIPEKAVRILNAYWCYLGIPISKTNFTVFAAMLYKYIDKGVFIPKMRSHEISSALLSKFYEYGGEAWFNTRVHKICVSDGKVTGVTTDRGEVSVDQVVANVPPHVAYSTMIEPSSQAPEIELRAADARKPGTQGFVLYLGLNKSAEELGLKEYSYFIFPSMDTNALYGSCGDIRNNNVQATVCLNNAVPDCSPPGTCIMSFTTVYTHGAWADVTPETYHETKNRIADGMIDYFEASTGIKIRDSIEEISIAGPPTFSRYAAAYNGSIYGYDTVSWDSLLPRLMMINEDYRIKGLRFCGGFAFRVHGYSSAYMSGQTMGLLAWKELQEARA